MSARPKVAAAIAAVTGVSLVAAAIPPLVRAALADELAAREGKERLLYEMLGMLLAGLGWDVVAGAMLPAAAVVGTAAWRGAPSRPLGEVFLRLALPYAGIAVLLTFGAQLVVPGITVAWLALLGCDPVARAERGESGFAIPSAARLLPLVGLAAVWTLLASTWSVLQMVLFAWVPELLEIPVRFAWQLVNFGGFLAWCEILRRFPREAVPKV